MLNLLPRHLLCDVQSEYGDIYRVTLEFEGDDIKEVKVKYFDTIPPCVAICVLKTGFLFAASEFGNHGLYQFLVCVSHMCIHELGHGWGGMVPTRMLNPCFGALPPFMVCLVTKRQNNTMP